VIIPAYGKSNLVLRLIASLRQQARLQEIIILDDASPEIDETVLKTIEGVKYYRNIANSGYVASCNRAFKKTESEYVLLLNSDTEATHPHCLEYMAENLDDGAAVCGALLLYPKDDPYRAERTQHAGIMYDADKFPQHIMAGWHPDNPAVKTRRSINSVTGACLMIKREWWNKAGGYDTKFGFGVFEDCDLTLTVRKLGGEVIYEPRSVFYHREHASQNQNGNWFSQENIHRNFTYLLLKHGDLKCDANLFFKVG
jgi:O-antigen biosynthesis protein